MPRKHWNECRICLIKNNIYKMEPKEGDKSQFLKKRQEYATEIRRQNRTELLSKRRNLGNDEANRPIDQECKINYNVDPRYDDYIKKFHKTKYYLEGLLELVNAVSDPDIVKQHYGVIGIRKILSNAEEPPIQPIIDTGVVPRLIQLINQHEYPQLQLQCTWSLANIASGSKEQCQSVIDKGAMDIFISLLRSPHLGIIEQAIWALGNIASDSSFNRDAITRKGGINGMMYVIQTCHCQQLVQSATWALSNLCRGTPIPNYEIIKNALFLICELLGSGKIKQTATFADCCWCLCYSFPKQKSDYQRIVTRDFVNQIAAKLSSHEINIIVPVVRVLGHITKINNSFVDYFLDNDGVIGYLYELLYYQKKSIRMETLWVISNIASGPQRHINAILSHQQLVVKILDLFQADCEDIRRQICCIFANMILEGSLQGIFRFFRDVNIIKYYVMALSSDDGKLILDSLDNMYAILELGEKMKQPNEKNVFVGDLESLGATDIILELQFHEEKSVYDAVVKILKSFFNLKDDNDF